MNCLNLIVFTYSMKRRILCNFDPFKIVLSYISSGEV